MTDTWTVFTVLVACVSVPGSLMLACWSVAALLPRRSRPTQSPERGTLAVVVPAHNEAASIGATVRALRKSCRADGNAKVWVVADNCTDDTALWAARAGAQVLVRTDPALRGKGHALEFAFKQLAHEGASWFVVVDADSTVEADFFKLMRQAMQPEIQALQACYLSRPTHTLRARLARLAQFGFNLVRPLGRSCMGVSVGLLGNGFALRTATTVAVPYTAHSVAEDLEYHLKLALAGVPVHYVPAAKVWGEIAESEQGATEQRARWEGGRFRMIREWTGPLLAKLMSGQTQVAEPLAELLLLPLGLHVVLLALASAALHPLGVGAALLGCAAVVLYLLAIAVRAPVSRADWMALWMAPAYLAWKLLMLPLTLANSRRQAKWVRAQRAVECP